MTPQSDTDRLAAIEAREAKATQMVRDLCKPKNERGAREWTMSIPARPDYDPDLVIIASLADIPWLLAQLKAATDEGLIAMRFEAYRRSLEAAERERDELKKTIARLEGRMCLICGASEPCELDKEEMSPCTFDPSPIEAAKRFMRERDEVMAALRKLAIVADYDFPGDGIPALAGYSCGICQRTGDTEDRIMHEAGCALGGQP